MPIVSVSGLVISVTGEGDSREVVISPASGSGIHHVEVNPCGFSNKPDPVPELSQDALARLMHDAAQAMDAILDGNDNVLGHGGVRNGISKL